MAAQSTAALRMLIELAARDVDLATEALAQSMKAVEEAQSRHNLLYEYKQGYVDSLNKNLAAGMGMQAYNNFQNFFGKLDQAIVGQLEVVESAKKMVQQKREKWQECQRKKLSYEVLIQRSSQAAVKVEQRRDQKNMDEYSMRISRSSRT